jgi:tRNAThr (cytosine32-N3)-methyltransferase
MSPALALTVIHFRVGAGNSIFPLLSENLNPDLSICAYDYSSHAVKLVQVSATNSTIIFLT